MSRKNVNSKLTPAAQAYYEHLAGRQREYFNTHDVAFPEDLYQEMSMERHYVEFHRDITLNKGKISLHCHNFLEIIYIVSGNIQYLLNQRRYVLQPGDVLLIPSGVSHQPLFPYELTEPYERYVLWIDKEFYRSLIHHFPEAGDCFLRCATSGEYLLRSSQTPFTPLLDAFQQGEIESDETEVSYSELSISLHAGTVLLWINRLSSETPLNTDASRNELLDNVLTYMDQHMDEKLTLEDTAAYFYVSQSTLSQLFRKYMDTSFYQCLMQKRLTFAKNRLLAGDSATKLYVQCGFSDYSSFFRAFKKNYGVSPREYLTLMN